MKSGQCERTLLRQQQQQRLLMTCSHHTCCFGVCPDIWTVFQEGVSLFVSFSIESKPTFSAFTTVTIYYIIKQHNIYCVLKLQRRKERRKYEKNSILKLLYYTIQKAIYVEQPACWQWRKLHCSCCLHSWSLVRFLSKCLHLPLELVTSDTRINVMTPTNSTTTTN